jgi:hypothetical protein
MVAATGIVLLVLIVTGSPAHGSMCSSDNPLDLASENGEAPVFSGTVTEVLDTGLPYGLARFAVQEVWQGRVHEDQFVLVDQQYFSIELEPGETMLVVGRRPVVYDRTDPGAISRPYPNDVWAIDGCSAASLGAGAVADRSIDAGGPGPSTAPLPGSSSAPDPSPPPGSDTSQRAWVLVVAVSASVAVVGASAFAWKRSRRDASAT